MASLNTFVAGSQHLTKYFLSGGIKSSFQGITRSLRYMSSVLGSMKGQEGKVGSTNIPGAGTPQDPPAESLKGKVTSHLTLHKCEGMKLSHLPEKDRPLVLMFQWLYAKPQSVQKYCDLYHDIGLDVLTVRGKLSHFLWPPVGVQLSCEIFKYLEENRPPDEKILIHAFSVGAYNYTIALEAADKDTADSGHFRNRIIGQIFDSIVIGSYENMSRGITEVLPNNKAFKQVVLQTLNVYYTVTHATTKDTYERLVRHFKEAPIPVPTLVFYSENDPMCDLAAMEQMLSNWKSVNPPFEVTKVSWLNSKHAAHLPEHREMYFSAWKGLMERLHLI